MSDALDKLRKLHHKAETLIDELHSEECNRHAAVKLAARKHSVSFWTAETSGYSVFGHYGPVAVKFEHEADARAFYASAQSRLGKTGVIELSDTTSIPANKVTRVAIDINPERD